MHSELEDYNSFAERYGSRVCVYKTNARKGSNYQFRAPYVRVNFTQEFVGRMYYTSFPENACV